MPSAVIAQPPRAGRVTGGYRYNQGLADGAAEVRIQEIEPGEVIAWARGQPGLAVWLDSLYLYPPHVSGLGLDRPGTRDTLAACGLIVHGLPPDLPEAAGFFGVYLCPSRWLAAELGPRLRAPRLVILYPGWDGGAVDATLRAGGILSPRPSGIGGTSAHRILTVANWGSLKGFEETARALAALCRQRPDILWRWTVAGERDPQLIGRTRRVLGDAGDRLEDAGVVDDTALGELYTRSSVFLLLSRAETYSLATQEAAIHGLPLVLSGVGGMPEAAARGRRLRLLLQRKDTGEAHTCVGLDPMAAARELERVLTTMHRPVEAPAPIQGDGDLEDARWAGRSRRFLALSTE